MRSHKSSVVISVSSLIRLHKHRTPDSWTPSLSISQRSATGQYLITVLPGQVHPDTAWLETQTALTESVVCLPAVFRSVCSLSPVSQHEPRTRFAISRTAVHHANPCKMETAAGGSRLGCLRRNFLSLRCNLSCFLLTPPTPPSPRLPPLPHLPGLPNLPHLPRPPPLPHLPHLAPTNPAVRRPETRTIRSEYPKP